MVSEPFFRDAEDIFLVESFLEEGRLCRCPDETQPPRIAVDDTCQTHTKLLLLSVDSSDTREVVPAWGADDGLTSL